ncbi:phage tail protein [Actinophytocola xanthii]|nr:phage tail protein [Actinophytocola xanthii]
MAMSLSAMLGLTTRFRVTVDGIDLGGWSKCTGLAVEFKSERVKEGGNYETQPILAGHLEYPNIQLVRAMNAADSRQVQAWLRSKVADWVNAHSSGGGGTAEITLLDAHLKSVASWSLRNVYPAKWDGPQLTAETFGIAVETLTLVHEGFL